MINLEKCNDTAMDTPLKGLLGFYNLKYDTNIIKTQVNLAKSFGIKGFSVYYYWFSTNTVSNNNMIMKDVVDRFFDEEYENFDIFFTWANENWTNNIAFQNNSNSHKITNEYLNINYNKNINNLLKYFKHKNYKKINNKPLLLVYHPWEFTREQLDLFYNELTGMCKLNGFDGIELILNGINSKYGGYKHFYNHPNYKKINHIYMENINNTNYINYKKYVYLYKTEKLDNFANIKTMFVNFNNTPRFLFHKTKPITKTLNNNIEVFKEFLNDRINYYKENDTNTDPVNKIFMINAWNEWGEQMYIEPSNNKDFLYLHTIQQELMKLL